MIMNKKQNILENHESRRACAPKKNIRTNIFERGNTKLFQVHTAYAALIRRQKNEPGALALPQNPNPNASKQHAKCTIRIPAKTNARTEVSDSGAQSTYRTNFVLFRTYPGRPNRNSLQPGGERRHPNHRPSLGSGGWRPTFQKTKNPVFFPR
jgi:hypothetical protein